MDTLTHERRMYAEKRILRLTHEIDDLLDRKSELVAFSSAHPGKDWVLKALNSKQTARKRWVRIIGGSGE